MGEGLLEWQVDTQTGSNEVSKKPPLNLPPPTHDVTSDQSSPQEQESHDPEGAESKTGLKRALSLSPNAVSHDTTVGSGDPVATEADAKSESKGPEIKRRNVAIYSADDNDEP